MFTIDSILSSVLPCQPSEFNQSPLSRGLSGSETITQKDGGNAEGSLLLSYSIKTYVFRLCVEKNRFLKFLIFRLNSSE